MRMYHTQATRPTPLLTLELRRQQSGIIQYSSCGAVIYYKQRSGTEISSHDVMCTRSTKLPPYSSHCLCRQKHHKGELRPTPSPPSRRFLAIALTTPQNCNVIKKLMKLLYTHLGRRMILRAYRPYSCCYGSKKMKSRHSPPLLQQHVSPAPQTAKNQEEE